MSTTSRTRSVKRKNPQARKDRVFSQPYKHYIAQRGPSGVEMFNRNRGAFGKQS